jgi:autotransporter translocation and assembly factor TamB
VSPPKEQPPPAGGPSAERPRRSKLRLALRTLVSLILALAIVVALALVFLHSPAGRAAARVSLESWGSQVTGGTLRLGQLEIALWKGHAAATALTLELPGTRLAVQRVSVDWPLGTRPQLLLVRPQVIVTDTGAAKRAARAVGLAAQPWLALERFRRVEVTDGRVELRDAKSAPWLVLAGLDAWGTEGSRQLSLRVAAADLGWPEGGLRVKGAALEGAFAVKEGSLQIAQARLTAGRSSLELAGALQRILPLTGSLSGRATLDGALVAAVSPGAEVVGQMELETAFDALDDRFKGTLTTSSDALTVSGVGPWSAMGRARFEGSALVVESFAIDGYGGHVEASGPVALNTAGHTELELRARGFDPVVVARALSPEASPPTALPLSAVASATLRVTASGWDFETARGTGQVALQPGTGPGLKPTGTAGVRIQGRTLAIADAHVEARGARVTADGELRRDRSVSGRWTAEVPLAAVPELMTDVGRSVKTPELSGRLRVEGEIKGKTSAPEVAARLRSEDLAVHGNPVGPGGRGALSGRTFVRRSARAAERQGTGDAHGQGAAVGRRTSGISRARSNRSTSLRRSSSPASKGMAPRRAPSPSPARATSRGRVSRCVRTPTCSAPTAPPGTTTSCSRLDGQSVGGARRARAARGTARWRARRRHRPLRRGVGRRRRGSRGERPRLGAPAARAARGAPRRRDARRKARACGEHVGARRRAVADARGAASRRGAAASARPDRAGRRSRAARHGNLRHRGAPDGQWAPGRRVAAQAGDRRQGPAYAALASAFPAMKEKAADIAGSGRLEVELPLREPARLRYASSDLAFSGHVRKLEWRIAPFSLEGDRESLQVSGLKLEADKAWISAHGKAGLAAASAFDFDVEGSLDFQALGPALPVRTFGGQGTLKLHVGGTHESPELDGALQLVDVRGESKGARVTDLDLEARFVGRDLRVERLQVAVLGGTVTASGDIPLLEKGGGASRFVVDVKDVDLAQLIDRELRASADSPSLRVSLEAELNAEAPSLARVSARGRLSRFDSQSLEGTLALEAPVAWSLERGGSHGRADPAEGSARRAGGATRRHARRGASGRGSGDLGRHRPARPRPVPARDDPLRSRHDRRPRDARRRRVASRRCGQGREEPAVARHPQLRGERPRWRAALRGRPRDARASAASSDGRLRASGGMRLGRSLLGTADLELTAERVPINYPAGFRGRASGGLRLSGEPGHYRVTGDVDVRQSFYTAEFSAESQSLDRLDWQLAALEGGSLADQIALDVNVRLAEPVRVRNATMKVDLEGSLTASGTLAQPTADGVVTMREGGELTVGRAQVRVSSGRIVLNGYPAGTPDLDFQGATSVSGIAFTLRASGGVDDLQLTLESDRSDLSQTDLSACWSTGRTAAAAASQGGVVVAEQLAVALGGVLQKGVGDTLVIDVAPDRSLLTEDTDPTQRMHIGTRITQNLTVLYSVALDGTQQRWIVELNPGGGRFRFRAITEEDNTFSVEGTDRFSFALWNRGPPHRQGAARDRPAGLAALRGQPAARRARAAQGDQAQDAPALQRSPARAGGGPRAQPARAGGLSLGERRRDHAAASGRRRRARAARRARPARDVRLERRRPGREDEAGGGAGVHLVRLSRGCGDAGRPHRAAASPGGWLLRRDRGGEDDQHRGPGGGGAPRRARDEGHERGGGLRRQRGRRRRDAARRAAQAGQPRILRGARPAQRPDLGRRAPRLCPRRLPARSRPAAALALRHDERPARGQDRGPRALARDGRRDRAARGAPGARAPAAGAAARAGRALRPRAYVADREALVAWYRAQGWIQAQAGSTIETRGGDVAVHYLVDKGPRPRIGSVSVVDGGNTKSSLLRHSIKLREGDYIKPTALAESRERLSDLGIYRSVDVRTEARTPGGELRDVVVGLVPKPDVQVEYGLRYTTSGNAGASGTAETTPSSADLQAAIAVELNSPFGYG